VSSQRRVVAHFAVVRTSVDTYPCESAWCVSQARVVCCWGTWRVWPNAWRQSRAVVSTLPLTKMQRKSSVCVDVCERVCGTQSETRHVICLYVSSSDDTAGVRGDARDCVGVAAHDLHAARAGQGRRRHAQQWGRVA
jgi:hypothetical protein